MAHTESHAGESIDLTAVEIDIDTCIAAATGVAAYFGTSVISRLTVLLEYDIDDARSAFRTVFRRRVGDDLDFVDGLCRNLFENLRTIVGGKSGFLAIYPYCH